MVESRSNRPAGIPSWVFLDEIFLYENPAAAAAATSAGARDTNGEPISVSFDLQPPPASSRVRLHYCPAERKPSGWDTVVAAHDSAVLFRVEVPFVGLPYNHRYAMDYFLYRASGPGSGPRLSLLPRCYSTFDEIMAMEVAVGKGANWRSTWRMVNKDAIGLLLPGRGEDDEEFVVAELKIDFRTAAENPTAPLEAELFRIHSSTNGGGQWELIPVTSRGGNVKFQGFASWTTHKVVPLRHYLCWVDYNMGVLFCDVCSKVPELKYIPFPLPLPHTATPHNFRALCVTNNGERETMKFVSVLWSKSSTPSPCPTCTCKCKYTAPGFTITVWTLIGRAIDDEYDDDDEMVWAEDLTIGADELWAMDGYDHDELSKGMPQFPVVSMDDPRILYFVSYGHDRSTWIVMLDLESKTILGYGDDKALPSDNIFNGFGFFPSNFSSFLAKHSGLKGELMD